MPIDFRALRFPGILSATTVPTGGTSDYGPEMLHAAAQGKAYACFVSREATLPFMTMKDAVRALLMLAQAPAALLTRKVYNVNAFTVTAQEIEEEVLRHFPAAQITYVPHEKREAIVHSWPGQYDDSAARRDWGWKPESGLMEAFRDYLVPGVKARYAH